MRARYPNLGPLFPHRLSGSYSSGGITVVAKMRCIYCVVSQRIGTIQDIAREEMSVGVVIGTVGRSILWFGMPVKHVSGRDMGLLRVIRRWLSSFLRMRHERGGIWLIVVGRRQVKETVLQPY